MIERIHSTFPAYEGSGINLNPQLDAAKLGLDLDGEVPEDIKTVALDALKNPYLLLQSITTYTSRVNMLIHRETEKIDIRADAELLRYKYENDRVTDAASPDASSPLPYQVYGNGKIGTDLSTKGTYNQLLERQKAHVQQFVATEDALNKAAEAKALCQKLLKRLHGSNDTVSSQILPAGGTSQNLGNIRHLELEVWTRERDVAGLRASLSTLTSEVQRLNKLCTEWKEAEDSLKKKWKKIEEFDARRSEVESIYTALLRANMDASAFWDQQPLAAREHAARTIIPACTAVVNISNSAKDLIEKEVSAFYQSLDNSLYMMPATAQGLLEFMGANGATGPDALSAAEKHAAILTARAGAGDPSAIPSICRISAALQYHPGAESSDAGLASVLESLEFCLKLRGSEASVLEDLSRAINLVHTRRNLVENNRVLLNHAHRVQQEYERMANYCLKLSGEQEKVVTERWLPELRNAVLDAQRCLTDCQRVRGLVDEWWEQPAATAVDWVTVDGQTVGAWLNLVKQLQMAFYDKELL
uniref:AUGMIN subunit 5 n=1 Tax=Elaeis guineensis var. tenera TaxID=51953 RepID=A0A6J0PGJ4_ELAGV|nr:AUGMIN subunit 5 [Elaeis guineensis]